MRPAAIPPTGASEQDNRRTERALVTAEGLLTAGVLDLPAFRPGPGARRRLDAAPLQPVSRHPGGNLHRLQ